MCRVAGGAGGETGFDGHDGSKVFENRYFTYWKVLNNVRPSENNVSAEGPPGNFLLKTRQMIIISFGVSAHEQTRFICRPRPSCPFFAQAEIKTIKDVLGREVKVDVPVKRAFWRFTIPTISR